MPLSITQTLTPAPVPSRQAQSRVTRSGHSVGRAIRSSASSGRLHAGSSSSWCSGSATAGSYAGRPRRRAGQALRVAWNEIDVQVAVERVGDVQQRVDPGRAAAALEPGDRGLRRADELGELALRETLLEAPRRDMLRDLGEEPAAVSGGDPLPESLQSRLPIASA